VSSPIYRLVIRPKAEVEIAEAAHWYETRERGLGCEFLRAVRAATAGAGHRVANLFVLDGRMSRNQRRSVLQALEALPDNAPRLLLATGRLIGEGFDHPPLDTLVLGMPIAWRGTLQQYAGHLHRAHASKSDVRILDYVDGDHPILARMWEKRRRGYRSMG
jgi:superfamily II DNA or RNA helicase